MATTVFIDGSETPLSAGQTTQVGGTQGPNATHNSTGAAGEFIGANFNYIRIVTADISGSMGLDDNGALEALPTIVNLVAQKATVVVVNNNTSGTVTSIITEGPIGWTQAALQLAIQHSDYETEGTTDRVVDSINLGTATVAISDALTLAA